MELARTFCDHLVRQRLLAVSCAADDGKDDPAETGRNTGSLERVYGLLPGCAAGRLRVCTRQYNMAGESSPGHVALPGPVVAADGLTRPDF